MDHSTLHEKLLATGSERGLFSHLPMEHFEKAPTVEAHEALAFFWDSSAAPETDEIELTDFPNLRPPVHKMAFIEGDKPLSELVGKTAGRVGFAVMVTGRQEMVRDGLPQLDVIDRAGAESSLTVQPFWEGDAEGDTDLDAEGEAGEDNEEADREVNAFPAAFLVPVDAGGKAALINGRPCSLYAPRQARPGELALDEPAPYESFPEEDADALKSWEVLVVGGALFACECLIAARNGTVGFRGDQSRHLKLDPAPLLAKLLEDGEANTHGLAHAMNVCREEFA